MMTVHAPKRRPQAAGIWAFCDQTGELRYMDSHPDSTVYTRWPVVRDRHAARTLEHAVDWVLNAAAIGHDALNRALMARMPGDHRYVPATSQRAYWERVALSGSLGAQAQLFVGDGEADSFAGFILDDSKDETAVSGFGGGRGGDAHEFDRDAVQGGGPGGGPAGTAGPANGKGGAHAEDGGGGRFRAKALSPYGSWQALIDNDYTASKLWMGGGGGGGFGNRDADQRDGGDSGDGLVRVVIGDLEESTSRNLQGQHGDDNGGAGSGGGYYALVTGSFSLGVGVTIRAAGRDSGDNRSGDGRIQVWYGESISAPSAQLSDIVLSSWRMLPAVPFGGLLVS